MAELAEDDDDDNPWGRQSDDDEPGGDKESKTCPNKRARLDCEAREAERPDAPAEGEDENPWGEESGEESGKDNDDARSLGGNCSLRSSARSFEPGNPQVPYFVRRPDSDQQKPKAIPGTEHYMEFLWNFMYEDRMLRPKTPRSILVEHPFGGTVSENWIFQDCVGQVRSPFFGLSVVSTRF